MKPCSLLDKWLKRALKKAPYYLLSKNPQHREWILKRWPDAQCYWVIWQEHVKEQVKTKLAIAEDGMCVRYGFNSIAILTGLNVTGLWQPFAGALNEEQLKALLDVANGRTSLPIFDINSLKWLSW